jgi:hypothetical protein
MQPLDGSESVLRLITRAEETTIEDLPRAIVSEPLPRTGPTIRVVSGERHEAADAGLTAMHAAGVEFYQRDRSLVRACIVRAKASNGQLIEVPGIASVTRPALARALGQSACWEKLNRRGEPFRIDPPNDVVEQIAAMVGEWPFLPLSGVISTPTLRPDQTAACLQPLAMILTPDSSCSRHRRCQQSNRRRAKTMP